ncbi:MAG: amidohydrolase family protein, partial [Cyanobacteria bacterium P01_D01_bin.115]
WFFESLWKDWEGKGCDRIRLQLAPANLHWCDDEALTQQNAYAQKYGVGMHMHLLETPYQMEYAKRRTGTTAVKHLNKLGILGEHLTLGHGVLADGRRHRPDRRDGYEDLPQRQLKLATAERHRTAQLLREERRARRHGARRSGA